MGMEVLYDRFDKAAADALMGNIKKLDEPFSEGDLQTLKANWVGDPPFGGFENYIENNGEPVILSEAPVK